MPFEPIRRWSLGFWGSSCGDSDGGWAVDLGDLSLRAKADRCATEQNFGVRPVVGIGMGLEQRRQDG
jgi:hypothetical protein